MTRQRRHGFTLIELLVVIAIIAILAAILFPVFAQAKTAAKKTVMISNMKQNTLAVIMYSDENDDMVPPRARVYFGPANGGPEATDGLTWEQMIMPYTKAYAMFQCGDDPRPRYQTPYGVYRRSLAAAGNVFIGLQSKRAAASSIRPSRTLGSLPQTSDTIMLGMRFMNDRPALGTANYWKSVDWATEAVLENTRSTTPRKKQNGQADDRPQYGQIDNVYSEGAAYAFCDGSARFVKMNGYPKQGNEGYPIGTIFKGYESRAGYWVHSLGYPYWDSGFACTDAVPSNNASEIPFDCAVPGEEPRVK